jgi:hypothetical protein
VIAASIFDHPAVLLLIGFIALVRWLISKAKTPTETTQTSIDPPPAQPITRGGQTSSEEERIRKFLEALGQPPGTTPPKVTPRPRAVPPKIFPKLPPLKTKPPPLTSEPRRAAVPPPLPIEAMAPSNAFAGEADYQVQSVAGQSPSEVPMPSQRGDVRSVRQIRLGTPQDLRTAIVLREIFGPPRSLQSIDLTSGF